MLQLLIHIMENDSSRRNFRPPCGKSRDKTSVCFLFYSIKDNVYSKNHNYILYPYSRISQIVEYPWGLNNFENISMFCCVIHF